MISAREEKIFNVCEGQYQVKELLGAGAFAEVYHGVQTKTRLNVALKCVDKNVLIKKEKNKDIRNLKLRLLETETQIMMSCDSPNVLKCHRVFEDQSFKVMVLDYCKEGSLYDLIYTKGPMPEREARQALLQIITGMATLQKNKVIHRDLKTENILIQGSLYKVADFGLAKNVEALSTSSRGTTLGTRSTMAPEVTEGEEYGVQADMWSLGVIYFQMLTQRLPFAGNVTQRSVGRIKQELVSLPISEQSKKLLESIFMIDPSKRLKWCRLYDMYSSGQGVFSEKAPEKAPEQGLPRQIIDQPFQQQLPSFMRHQSPKTIDPLETTTRLKLQERNKFLAQLNNDLKTCREIQKQTLERQHVITKQLFSFGGASKVPMLLHYFYLLVLSQLIHILELNTARMAELSSPKGQEKSSEWEESQTLLQEYKSIIDMSSYQYYKAFKAEDDQNNNGINSWKKFIPDKNRKISLQQIKTLQLFRKGSYQVDHKGLQQTDTVHSIKNFDYQSGYQKQRDRPNGHVYGVQIRNSRQQHLSQVIHPIHIIQYHNLSIYMHHRLRKAIAVALLLIIIAHLASLLTLYSRLDSPYYQYLSFTIHQQQSTQTHVDGSEQAAYQPQPHSPCSLVLDSNGSLCLRVDSNASCIHSHSLSGPISCRVQTRDFVVAETATQLISVHKNISEGLRYMVTTKDHHIKSKDPAKYIRIPESNTFVVEWPKVYTVYQIQEHQIESCLFLEKLSNNYTQLFVKSDGPNITLLSFPKRNQILLQIYNCQTKKVELVKKVPVQGWIKGYRYKMEDQRLTVSLETSAGDDLSYVFDQDLALSSQRRVGKNKSDLEVVVFQPSYQSTIPLNVLKYIKAAMALPLESIAKWRYNPVQPRLSDPYSYNSVRFYRGNRLFQYNQFSKQLTTRSLGKYLIPTETPLFHNFGQVNVFKKQLHKPEPVYYLTGNVINSEDYINVFEVYPKYQAEWVGFSKGFLHFYPSQESKRPRMSRLPEGGLYFEGSLLKNTWTSQPRNNYQVIQKIDRKPQLIDSNLYEGHAAWDALIAVLDMASQRVQRVNILNGYSGVKIYSYQLERQFSPEEVFVSLHNNQMLVSTFTPSTGESKVAKIQIYAAVTETSPSFKTVTREYTLRGKLVSVQQHSSNYYLVIEEGQGIKLCKTKDFELNNRRPTRDGKYSSTFEARLAKKQLPTSTGLLEVRCVVWQPKGKVSVVKRLSTLLPSGSEVILYSEQLSTFLLLDAVNLIDNKISETLERRKIAQSLGMVVLGIVICALLWARTIRVRAPSQTLEMVTMPNKKSKKD